MSFPPNPSYGGGGGSFVINDDHFFADNNARDTYFTAHPDELETGTLIKVGTEYQQYNGTSWTNVTAVIDLDATLAANSDSRVPSQKAVKTYADGYKPIIGSITLPNSLKSSENVEKLIAFPGYAAQGYAANGDYMTFTMYCAGTETHLEISIYKSVSRGIFDIYINGILDSSGYDTYAASGSASILDVLLSQPIIAGWNTIVFKVNGKNASSSGYYINIYGVRLR